jgi:hypothetical protein
LADVTTGLTTAEAQQRQARDGLNAIVDVSQHPVWRAIKKLWAPVPMISDRVKFVLFQRLAIA